MISNDTRGDRIGSMTMAGRGRPWLWSSPTAVCRPNTNMTAVFVTTHALHNESELLKVYE